MAIRDATFAMVPVKRFWRLVKPLSKGEPDCAWAARGRRKRTQAVAASGRIHPLIAWLTLWGMTTRMRRDIGTSCDWIQSGYAETLGATRPLVQYLFAMESDAELRWKKQYRCH